MWKTRRGREMPETLCKEGPESKGQMSRNEGKRSPVYIEISINCASGSSETKTRKVDLGGWQKCDSIERMRSSGKERSG